MQSGDIKLLVLGGISVGILSYYFKKFSESQKIDKQNFKKFQQCYQYSQKEREKSLKEIMTVKNQLNGKKQQLKEKAFCFIDVSPKLNDSTYSIYERERSKYQGKKYPNDELLEHQMGGDFQFKHRSDKLKCQLNDFYLSAQLLQEKQKKPVKIFQGISKVQPIVFTVLTMLKNGNLSIYGNLFYDNNNATWTVQPYFLTPPQQLKSTVETFFKSKITSNRDYKFAILFSGLVIGYFTIFKPLMAYFNKKKPDNFLQPNEIDFFKNKEYITVKGESLLNCQSCKDHNVEMVYQCGHLALCVKCHQSNEQRICPLCRKVSTKFMRIFMA